MKSNYNPRIITIEALVFTEAEIAYLASQRIGRLATWPRAIRIHRKRVISWGIDPPETALGSRNVGGGS